MSRNSFDILASVCRELALISATQTEKDWDDRRFNPTSKLLLKCSILSRAFREAAAPYVFRTINLKHAWPNIEVRMEALKSSRLLKRYVRTVRFFAPKWTARDIIHTRFRWIFREFAAILAALPHLQAVAMACEDERVPEMIQQSFASEQFVGFFNERRGPVPSRAIELPSVTELSIDDEFRFVAEYCPNLQRVFGTGNLQPLLLAQKMAERHQLESFSLNMWISATMIRGLSTCMPHLLELRLSETVVTLGNFEMTLFGLAAFHCLRRFLVKDLGYYIPPEKNETSPTTPTELLDDAEEVFVDVIQRKIPSLQEIRVQRRLYVRDEEQQGMKLFSR